LFRRASSKFLSRFSAEAVVVVVEQVAPPLARQAAAELAEAHNFIQRLLEQQQAVL
jgi:hypothetical protein